MHPPLRSTLTVILLAVAGCADFGKALQPVCDLSAASLDFGPVLVGQQAELSVVVRSVGPIELPVDVASGCGAFTVIAGAGRGRLAPGGARTVTVRFSPAALGATACVLTLGPGCPSVGLTGEGRSPGTGPQCSIAPTSIDFGVVAVGQFAERSFTIHSVGSSDLAVDVQSPCPVFTIVTGAGAGALAPGAARTVTVRFTPPAVGPASCAIATGTACGGVSLTADGEPPASVSFANDIQPIFNNRCASCHPPEGAMSLTAGFSYDNIVNVETSGYAPLPRIAPGDTATSVLYLKVKGLAAYGERMPPLPDPAMPVAERLKLRAWILEGARRN